tara:strand:- start:409 stop:735 length:327 start_codon:yes stop_codon:yes gene_type:complete
MKDSHKDCIREIQDLMLAINETVEKYELKGEVLIAMAVGFLDMDKKSILPDEEGVTVSMNLLSSISVDDEEELEDLLSYVEESYRMEQEDNPSNINYWINRMGDGDLN